MVYAKLAIQSKFCFGLLLGFFVFSLMMSCQEPDQARQTYPYFQFDRTDEQQFVNYDQKTILTFTSATAPTRTYKVNNVARTKQAYSSGMSIVFSGGVKHYYYDDFSIRLGKEGGTDDDWVISYRKAPSGTLSNGSGPDYSTVKLIPRMNMWEWNYYGSAYYIPLNDKSSLVSLAIGNQLISGVQKISSGVSSEEKSNQAGRYDQTISTLYFHSKLGVLGFDDVAGNQWRLVK